MPSRGRRPRDLVTGFLASLGTALALAASAGPPEIRVDNEAKVPAAELESILTDFRAWATRVYAYLGVEPGPVTLKLTREVPFGFYRDGTVLLPPSRDRWDMLDNWVHELSHHATGHDSSFFFKEGIAVHTLERLFGEAGRVPDTWPQFGQSTDAWVLLYESRGRLPPLRDALAWEHYRGATADEDFRSWQIYNIAGSFTGWYLARHGLEHWRKAFAAEWPREDSADLERAWLAALRTRKPAAFDPARVLPATPRYRAYAERLKPAS